MAKGARNLTGWLFQKNFWSLLILTGVVIGLLRFLFLPGFPLTHDGENHLARLANFRQAIIDGHIPPRWAPNLNHRFGYPVFHFNYYLPQALALMLSAVPSVSFEAALKGVIILSFLTGGLFVYLWLKEKLGVIPALTAGIIYLVAPYQIGNVFVRGNLGEIVAAGLFPGIIWASTWFLDRPNRVRFTTATLLAAAFLLSHNIAVLFGFPLLLGFIALEWSRHFDWAKGKMLLLAFLLGIGLTQFFWLPALFEKQFTNVDSVRLSASYYRHFPTFGQLLHSPWGYGFSRPGEVDELSFEVGPFHWLILTFVVGMVLSRGRRVFQDRFWPWLAWGGAVFFGGVLLMNQVSLPLWRSVPVLHYIQFPWRLLLFLPLPLALGVAWLTRYHRFLGIVIALGAFGYALTLAKPQSMFHFDDFYYREFPFDTSVLSENMPRWFQLNKNLNLTTKVFDIQGVASFRELEWKTQKHRYEIDGPRETLIIERTAYFPGWEVKVDGKPVKIDYEREDYPGLISFSVPSGRHSVESRFTEHTPARILGDSISLGSLAILGIVLKRGVRSPSYGRKKTRV